MIRWSKSKTTDMKRKQVTMRRQLRHCRKNAPMAATYARITGVRSWLAGRKTRRTAVCCSARNQVIGTRPTLSLDWNFETWKGAEGFPQTRAPRGHRFRVRFRTEC